MSEATPVVHYGHDVLEHLPEILHGAGAQRVLVVTGAGGGRCQGVLAVLAKHGFEARVFKRARAHVPRPVVDAARREFERAGAQAVVTVGGGSATGLGKALRRSLDFLFVAVPTTYAGSEMTAIWGVTDGGDKETGRDEAVRPDFVLYDPALSRTLPARETIQSILNAIAHPVGALSTQSLTSEGRRQALEAVSTLLDAARRLVVSPHDGEARESALRGASLAGRVLDAGRMGTHHRLAHMLGGRFDLPHAPLHAVLLPQTVRALAGPLAAELGGMADAVDLPLELHELLLRVEAPVSLQALGVERAALEKALAEATDAADDAGALARAAWLGRLASWRIRREDWGLPAPVAVDTPVAAAHHVVVALHQRDGNADAAVRRIRGLLGHAPGIAIVAPQADAGTWYPGSYRAPLRELGPKLDRALAAVDSLIARVREAAPAARVSLAGFSDGGCVALEWTARRGNAVAQVIALAAARIGPATEQAAPAAKLDEVQVLLAVAESDQRVAADDVRAAGAVLQQAGAQVELLVTGGDGHEMPAAARLRVREMVCGCSPRCSHAGGRAEGRPGHQGGFGNAHASEALAGALPRDRNSPRHPPYGLWAEQISGTGFVARRHENMRSWLYRIRPSTQHRAFSRLAHPTFGTSFAGRPPEPDLCGWDPVPIPDRPRDFVDGIATLGGAGDPALRRGYAIHAYAANRDMAHRAFYDADGDLLLLPELGGLILITELGVIELGPGQLAIVPRGMKVSVLLRDGQARGYVAETFGRHFQLPERGPVGANGLADERHFFAPSAWYEDRLDPGFRITAKLGGRLHEATQDYSPFDVVAWHGNYAPYVYDLMHFSPVSNVRFDHADPSVYTVLTAPLDEPGSHTLDLVVFPPRWDPTQGTFRPPYFHRNVTSELNGIIRQPPIPGSPFKPGQFFLTPSMTAHGVVARSVERFLALDDETADRPSPPSTDSLWFQFEMALPLSLTPWAEHCSNRIPNWRGVWGVHRTRFDPGAA